MQAKFIFLTEVRNYAEKKYEGDFLKFIWNSGTSAVSISINKQIMLLEPQCIICATYLQQIVLFDEEESLVMLLFNREFYCIHTNDKEVSCNGLLFFGSTEIPYLKLDSFAINKLLYLIQTIKDEFAIIDSNQEEMLRILLKQFIICCTRIAKAQFFKGHYSIEEIDVIREFNILVEENFKTLHKVSDYAKLLNKSPKTITNIFSRYTNISPLKVIHQRIVMEAKRMLLYTNLSIKEISYQLGYSNPEQFSKLFKKIIGYSLSAFKKNDTRVIG